MNINLITNDVNNSSKEELIDNEIINGLYEIKELINRLSKTRDKLEKHMGGLLELERKLL